MLLRVSTGLNFAPKMPNPQSEHLKSLHEQEFILQREPRPLYDRNEIFTVCQIESEKSNTVGHGMSLLPAMETKSGEQIFSFWRGREGKKLAWVCDRACVKPLAN